MSKPDAASTAVAGVGRDDRVGRVALLAVVLGACAVLLRSPGTTDVHLWESWLARVSQFGLTDGYARIAADYPPGALTLLRVSRALVSGSSFDAVKAVIAVFLVGTAAAMGLWFRDVTAATVTIAALVVSALGLGYLDVLFALPLVLSLWALERDRLAVFSAFFAATCLVKWQPIILVPVLAVYLLPRVFTNKARLDVRRLIALIVPGLVVGVVAIGGFGIRPIAHSLRGAVGQPLLSGDALNVGWLVTAFHGAEFGAGKEVLVTESAAVASWIPFLSRVVLAVTLVALLVVFWRGARAFAQLIAASVLATLAYVALATGVHENHLFLACVVAIVGLWVIPSERTTFSVVIAITQLNLVAFFGVTGSLGSTRVVAGVDTTVPLTFLVLAASAYVFWRLLPVVGSRAPAGDSLRSCSPSRR